MATRASLSKIQSQVYAYLNVDGGTYGTYVSNARYPSAAIDDAIYDADNFVGMLLSKNGQEPLMQEMAATKIIISSGTVIPNTNEANWVLISVQDSGTGNFLKEIPYTTFLLYSKSSYSTIMTQDYGYYSVKNNRLYFLNNSGSVTANYIQFPKNTTIKSPDGFEEAIACRAAEKLLMKRADNPAASAFCGRRFQEIMMSFGMNEVSLQDFSEK